MKRLMKLKKSFGLMSNLSFAILLAGCVSQTEVPVVKPAQGVPPRVALEEFAMTLATAELVDSRCRSSGLRKVYSDDRQMITDYAIALQAQGHSRTELLAVVDALSVEKIAANGFARLKAKGVREGDVESVCRFGRAEIAADSAVGRLLRDGA